MKIAIRLTIPWTDKLTEFFSSLDRAVVYQHDADEEVARTHIHALAETSVSTDTLKNRLEKVIGYRLPKTDWAFTQKIKHNPVEDRFITYMSKGKYEPKYLKGFTQEDCDNYKSLWVEKSPSSATEKKQTMSGFQISKELAEYIDAVTGTDKWIFLDGRFICDNPNGRHLTEEEIIDKCINIHNKYEKSYCDFSLVRCIQTAYGLSQRGSWKTYLIQSVKNKLAIKL